MSGITPIILAETYARMELSNIAYVCSILIDRVVKNDDSIPFADEGCQKIADACFEKIRGHLKRLEKGADDIVILQEALLTCVKISKLGAFVLKEEDFAGAGFDMTQYKGTPDCLSFAFFHMHEEALFSQIFGNNVPWVWPKPTTSATETQMDVLLDLGYQFVDSPISGDLAVYVLEEENIPVTRHWGIVFNENFILSKWGSMPAILGHAHDQVTFAYGNRLYFMRKTYKFVCAKKIASALKRALTTFDHPACASPLSQLGMHQTLVNGYTNLIRANYKKALSRSFFGKQCIRNWGKQFLKRVRTLNPEQFTDKFRLLEAHQKLLVKTHKAVRPMFNL